MTAQLIPPMFRTLGFDGTLWIPMFVDAISGAVVDIDLPHERTHQGKRYTVIVSDNTLAAGASIEILMRVPVGVYPHMTIPIFASSNRESTVELWFNTTVSADGTPITPFNLNMNSPNTADLEVYLSPTITLDGTNIYSKPFGASGTNPAAADTGGSVGGDRNELILKLSTNFLARLTNNDATDSSRSTIEFNWYEN